MAELYTGFARTDITPPLGVSISGYFHERLADGVLDPLYASAVYLNDGKKGAILINLDIIGINQKFMMPLRQAVASAIDCETDGVFIECTHTHLGPAVAESSGVMKNEEYSKWLVKRIADTALMAKNDAVKSEMYYTRGRVEDVAFIRRFRMKDGSVRTNPGHQNPNIDHVLGKPDESSSLLMFRRENKSEIAIINFQVHPDVIGGCKLSADYPHFVRDTYEKNVENSVCVYINGCQGDSNHIDVRLGSGDVCLRGYPRAEYMGKKIAMSVLANRLLAKKLEGCNINYGHEIISVKYNKGKEDELENALKIYKIYRETGSEDAASGTTGMRSVEIVAEASRIVRLMDYPDEKELCITALSVGDVVFAGFPGEPFTQVGVAVKENSPFTLTMTACCANGYEGYYPVASAYDEGGYEALTAQYVKGTAEQVIDSSLRIINSLK